MQLYKKLFGAVCLGAVFTLGVRAQTNPASLSPQTLIKKASLALNGTDSAS